MSPGGTCRRGTDLVTMALGLVTLAVSWALALRRPIHPLEEDAYRALNDLPEAARLVWPVMQVGSFGAIPVVAGLAFAATRSRRLAAALLTAGIGSWAVAKGVKAAVGRGRPADCLPESILREATSGLGFVSGHSAVAAALAVTLAPYVPRRWRYGMAVIVGLVGAGRIFFGAHLPVDVVGGYGLGMAVGGATNMAFGVPARTLPGMREDCL